MELIAEPEFVSQSASPREKSDRQMFYGLDFNELDRGLTSEERQEWNSIYASYRGRSALTGSIIGIDPLSISVRNKQTGTMERQTMYCAVVVPYRVRIVIPSSEMWEDGQERPNFVLQNMVHLPPTSSGHPPKLLPKYCPRPKQGAHRVLLQSDRPAPSR